jgi:hypothetical protein
LKVESEVWEDKIIGTQHVTPLDGSDRVFVHIVIIPIHDGEILDVVPHDTWAFVHRADPYKDIEEGFQIVLINMNKWPVLLRAENFDCDEWECTLMHKDEH